MTIDARTTWKEPLSLELPCVTLMLHDDHCCRRPSRASVKSGYRPGPTVCAPNAGAVAARVASSITRRLCDEATPKMRQRHRGHVPPFSIILQAQSRQRPSWVLFSSSSWMTSAERGRSRHTKHNSSSSPSIRASASASIVSCSPKNSLVAKEVTEEVDSSVEAQSPFCWMRMLL